MKGLGEKTLHDLETLYKDKGYLVLDDISFVFELRQRDEVLVALSILKSEGYIVKKDQTDCPIKFNFVKNPMEVEWIDAIKI